MKNNIDQTYLNLIKKTLAFLLWPEPPAPIELLWRSKRAKLERFIIPIISKIFKKFNLQIGKIQNFSSDERTVGKIWPGYADTMIGIKRLDNIQHCIEDVLNEKIEGDLIETGAWRGGACIFMRAVLKVYGVKDRKIFVADSFKGLPKPDAEKYPADKGDDHHTHAILSVSRQDVEMNFKKYDLLDEQVVFLEGWFKDTLPQAPIEKLSILRLDGDMYSSTMECLEILYPKLSKGGYCIIDDYALSGCNAAVNDYRSKNKIESEIKKIDWTGIYWKK